LNDAGALYCDSEVLHHSTLFIKPANRQCSLHCRWDYQIAGIP